MLPFFKPKKGFMIAGGGLETSSGGGGGGGGSSFPDLSTDETNTGIKNVDGKDIYMRVFTELPVEDNYSRVISISGLDHVIDIHGYVQSGNQQYGLQYWNVYASNDIRVTTFSSLSSADTTGEIIVFYTKVS